MRPRLIACAGIVLLVAGCSGESHQDLRAWMQEQGKGAKGKLDPLPQVKPYEPFTYNAFDLPDPFKPRKLSAPRENRVRLPAEPKRCSFEAPGQRQLAARKSPIRAGTPSSRRMTAPTPSSKGCAATRNTAISESPERPEGWRGRM